MSIIKKRFSAWLIFIVEILVFAFCASAQDIEATIKFTNAENIRVEGKIKTETNDKNNLNWSFVNFVADAENLAERVADFNLSNEKNQSVEFKKLTSGEFLASEAASNFSYDLRLTAPLKEISLSHVSWLANEQGILMLGDVLPQIAANKKVETARIKFDLPVGWRIISGEKLETENVFFVRDIENSIFVVGKNWRTLDAANLNLTISGEWQFSDAEAGEAVGEIYNEYRKIFGETISAKPQIFLMHFPQTAKLGRWTAETRGANLTIVSADMPFKTQAIQRFHEQIRHEFFHLWLPNQLNLTGNYDWFYEGFTVYQSLRTGVRLNRIGFDNFLDTLAQAYNLDSFQSRRVSLIESSKNRWTGADNPVYARGMLAAFLIDAAILRASKGNRDITEIFREVWQTHRKSNVPTDGNQAILRILKNHSELDSIVEKYVVGAEAINWKTDLETLGIESSGENSSVRLKVKAKLNSRQKDLLDELGYNNWRKISDKRK